MHYKKILVSILAFILLNSIVFAANIIDSSSGTDFQIYLSDDGNLYGIGDNTQGELGKGNGAKNSYEELEFITNGVAIPQTGNSLQKRTITAGADFSVIVKSGKAYSAGENYFGQLGIGGNADSRSYVLMQGDGVVNNNIVSVSAGADYVLLLNSSGEVLGTGDNAFGQIKEGGLEQYNKLISVYSNPSNPAKAIATGTRHSVILLNDGSVVSLGDGTSEDKSYYQRNIVIPPGRKVVEIAAGNYHTLVRLDDGSIWGVGNNENQQLAKHEGGGSTNDKYRAEMVELLDDNNQSFRGSNYSNVIRTLGAGYDFSIIMNNNSVTGMGDKYRNQLGKEAKLKSEGAVRIDTIDFVENITAGWQHSIIMGKDKNVSKTQSKGDKFYGDVEVGEAITEGTNKSIAMGAGHSLYVKDNILYGAGNNSYGQLGVTTYSSSVRKIPFDIDAVGGIKQIVTGATHSVILGYDNSIWVTGYNYSGQLGLGDNLDRYSFTKLEYVFDSRPIAIAAGGDITLILTQEGTVYGMGDNSYGQLIEDDSKDSYNIPIPIIIDKDVVQVTAGVRHIMALQASGTVIVKGMDVNLLNGINNVTKIASGAYHGLVLSNGMVKSAGENINGQLGNGSIVTPTYVTNVSFSETVKVKNMVAGYSHSMFLTDKGIFVCGSMNGEANKLSPQKIIVIEPKEIATGWLGNMIRTTNSIVTIGNNLYAQRGIHRGEENSTYDDAISNLSKKKIAAGDGFTMVLHSDGILWGVGNNTSGQLGLGDNSSRSKFVKINSPVEVGNIVEIEAGDDFTLILTRDGDVYGTGRNTYGVFGNTNASYVNQFTKLNITNVKKIFADSTNIIVLKNDDSLWAVGNLNTNGASRFASFTEISVNLAANEYIKNVIKNGAYAGLIISNGNTERVLKLSNSGPTFTNDEMYYGSWQLQLVDVSGVKKLKVLSQNASMPIELEGNSSSGYVHMITTEGTNELVHSSNTNKIIGKEFGENIVDVAVGKNHVVVITESEQLYVAGENKVIVNGITEYGLLGNETLNKNNIASSKVFIPMYIQALEVTTGIVIS